MRLKQHSAWLILVSFTLTVGSDSTPVCAQQPPSSQPHVSQPAGSISAPQAGIDIRTAGSFRALLAVLEASGLAITLVKPGAFTLFAPTDQAFAALPEGTLEELLQPANKAILLKIISYHLVPGKVISSALQTGPVQTLEGNSIVVQVEPSKGLKVNNARVILADVPATNGVIYVIDKVILPPDIFSPLKAK